MSQDGKAACGWYEDVVGDETEEVKELATNLLKDKLTEVFGIIKEKRREKEIMRERERQKDDEAREERKEVN